MPRVAVGVGRETDCPRLRLPVQLAMAWAGGRAGGGGGGGGGETAETAETASVLSSAEGGRAPPRGRAGGH